MKPGNIFVLILICFILIAIPEHRAMSAPHGNEVGYSSFSIKADLEGVTGPYQSSQYDRTIFAHGNTFYFAINPWTFGKRGTAHAYVMRSYFKNTDTSDFGLEFRQDYNIGYLGLMINIQIPPRMQINDWPEPFSTQIYNANPMALGLSFGYKVSENWSIRFSTLYNKEYMEFKIIGNPNPEVGFITSTRSILTLVYNFNQEEEEAAE